MGCYVPAQAATFRISDHMFSRLSFSDSIECNASTFVLELKEFQFIRQMLTPLSLVIVDELCRGTSCEEGTAIAWVIIEQLMEEDAFIFLTTHFLYLTKLQELYCNVTNHHFEALWDRTDSGRDRLIYTHKLLPGVTQVENYGLHLAQGLACPESVLACAKDLARKLSSQRKAFGSSAMKSEMHNYYKLASTVTECKRDGILSVQKLEEIKQKFYVEVGETSTTEAQVEDGSTVQEEEAIELLNEPECARHEMATKSKSSTFLQQHGGEDMLREQREKEMQPNMCSKDRIYNHIVATKPVVPGLVQEEEPMERDDIFPHEGSIHLTPIISLPEGDIL